MERGIKIGRGEPFLLLVKFDKYGFALLLSIYKNYSGDFAINLSPYRPNKTTF